MAEGNHQTILTECGRSPERSPLHAVYHLSDFLPNHPCDVTCAACGLSQAYTPREVIAELGNQRAPMALQLIAALHGCDRLDNEYRDRCALCFRYPPGAVSTRSDVMMDARLRASQARRAHLPWTLSEDWPGYTIASLPEWIELLSACRCCYRALPIERSKLRRALGANAELNAIERKLRCAVCGNRSGNRLFLLKAPR